MRVVTTLLIGLVIAGCGGSAETGGPLVRSIDDALAALSDELALDDPDLFEVAIDLDGVTLVLAETEIDNDTGDHLPTHLLDWFTDTAAIRTIELDANGDPFEIRMGLLTDGRVNTAFPE